MGWYIFILFCYDLDAVFSFGDLAVHATRLRIFEEIR
jgi:hypothetical protein